jgi:putative membrane protein
MFELKFLINGLVFSIVGLIILSISFWIFDKLTPGELWEEIVDKQNVALSITAAAMIIAMAQIIAAAIHG